LNDIRKRALLEPIIANYEIDDVTEPNLLRDIFPYDEIPKIQFD
jgi:hypothetical protein